MIAIGVASNSDENDPGRMFDVNRKVIVTVREGKGRIRTAKLQVGDEQYAESSLCAVTTSKWHCAIGHAHDKLNFHHYKTQTCAVNRSCQILSGSIVLFLHDTVERSF